MICLSCLLMAQESTQTIMLKDGTEIVGKIISMDSGQVLIQSENLNKIYIDEASIKRIDYSSEYLKSKRDYFNVSTGVLLNKNNLNATLQMGYHRKMKHALFLGGGLGVDIYDYDNGDFILPIFATIGVSGKRAKLNPFAAINLGYGFTITDDESSNTVSSQGGLMINPRYGVEMVNDNFSVSFFGGLKFQKATYIYEVWNGEFEEENKYRKLEFGIGFNF